MAEARPASLDASFWTVGHRADVLPYLFSYFEVHVPPASRGELLADDRRFPRRRYGYAEMYRLLEGRGLLSVAIPSRVGPEFGRGEAEAIALAQEHNWWLLINDHRALAYAHRNGIQTVSVPAFIYLLYEDEVISLRAARRKLDEIERFTNLEMLQLTRQALARLARLRREQDQ